MSSYDRVRTLPLTVEGEYELEPLGREVARGFTLRRTTIVLRGGGHEGRGEDVDYDPETHQVFLWRRLDMPLPRQRTLSARLALQAGVGVSPLGPRSAALDLALRQAGRSLAEVVGRA